MDSKTAEILCRINTEFYRAHGASFSATRAAAWPGWERCLEVTRALYPEGPGALTVFDLACGNLRFATFLQRALPSAAIDYYGVDNCDELVPLGTAVRYQSLDVLGVLLDGLSLSKQVAAPPCDLSVSFGFLHHVPGQEYREAVLAGLVEQTRPGGYVIVSLWRFMDDAGLASKARAATARALGELGLATPLAWDEGDYLLDWQNVPGAYRYCHSFSDDEIDRLVASVAGRASLATRFFADGRTGRLNTYLVLRVTA